MTTLPTVTPGNHRSDLPQNTGTSKTGTDPVLEAIATPDDADFVFSALNATGTHVAVFDLGDMPADFDHMDTLSVRLRYHKSAHSGVNTWNSLTAQIYQSDGTTQLCDERTIATTITTTTPTNSPATTLISVNTTADKTVWDGALLFLRFAITKSMGGDADEERVTAAELTGTYTQAVAGDQNIVPAAVTVNVAPGTLTVRREEQVTPGSVTVTATPGTLAVSQPPDAAAPKLPVVAPSQAVHRAAGW
jgi:hypothetical protein